MKKLLFTISLVLVAAISIPVNAQLSNVLKKAKNAATKTEETISSTADDTETLATIKTSAPVERKTQPVDILKDEKIDLQTFVFHLDTQSPDSIDALQKQIEARHKENLAINDEQAKAEIERYETLIWFAKNGVELRCKSEISWEGEDRMIWKKGYMGCNNREIKYEDDKPYLYDDYSIKPLTQENFQKEVNYYENLKTLLYRSEIKVNSEQYEEFWKAACYSSEVRKAQANTLSKKQ